MRKIIVWGSIATLAGVPTLSSTRTAVETGRGPVTSATLTPAYCNAAHNVGRLGLAISNDGTIGGQLSVSSATHDCFTGEDLRYGEFPLGSETMYLFAGALWIGAVVGTDTLVSTGADGWSTSGNEFHPDNPPLGNIVYRSTVDPRALEHEGAVSEQDYIAVYRDTCRTCYGVSNDQMDGRPHIPLNLEVKQSSYAWSLPHAEDFVLIDYSIKNIGAEPLNEVYVGVFVDGDVHDNNMNYSGAGDDFSGMWSGSHSTGLEQGCNADVELDVAWIADNDGDLDETSWTPVPHVTGVCMMRWPTVQSEVSFNWFVSNGDASLDFGPMRRAKQRDFGTGGTGTPEGDRNKYYLLSNGDRDYDQVRCATIPIDDSIWLPPPADWAHLWSMGLDTRYVLSVGPLTLEPGQSTPLTFAYVAGENLHTDSNNFNNLPENPDAYLAGLDFSDLATNAVWAGWVYDNPGVDTDSDGYAGDYQMCEDDTVWYHGDGVPDFCATGQPVAPQFWLEPRPRGLWVRWNGFASESEVDWATRQVEFEGYHAYLSTAGAPSDFACLASYDVEDFYRYHWDGALLEWLRSPYRITIDEALCLYASSGCNDAVWHPSDYTRQAPYVMPGHPDSMFYFEPVLANAWRFGLETPFVKRYPEATKPLYARPSDVPQDSADFYLTPDGYFKYYEYEFLIDRLLPEQTYWVTITAFECSSLVPEAIAPETAIAGNAKTATPLAGPCCHGTMGNAGCDNLEKVTLQDLMVLVDHLFISGRPLCCIEEGDMDQSGGGSPVPADITLLDVMILVDYLFITGPDNMTLPECP